jgi:hypothetical protein
MFSFLNPELKIVRKLRLQFDDIRQRVFLKMNSYEQYSFCSAFETFESDISDNVSAISETDYKKWLQVGQDLMSIAKQGYEQNRSLGGISGDGGRAGVEGVGFLIIKYMVRVFNIPEAKILRDDIAKFEEKMSFFMKGRENSPYTRMTL